MRNISNRFTFAENRKITKVFYELENLAKENMFFAEAVSEYSNASQEERYLMNCYLLKIYNECKHDNLCSLRNEIILRSYQ